METAEKEVGQGGGGRFVMPGGRKQQEDASQESAYLGRRGPARRLLDDMLLGGSALVATVLVVGIQVGHHCLVARGRTSLVAVGEEGWKVGRLGDWKVESGKWKKGKGGSLGLKGWARDDWDEN